jgi:hypothetical protein
VPPAANGGVTMTDTDGSLTGHLGGRAFKRMPMKDDVDVGI